MSGAVNKFLSLIILWLVVLSFFPNVSVSAAENTFDISDGGIWIVNGTETDTIKIKFGGEETDNIPDETQITIIGSYSLPSYSGGMYGRIRIDSATANIKLSNVNINCQTGLKNSCAFAIGIDAPSNVTLELEGDNILRSSSGAAGLRVRPGSSLNILGNGSLSVYGGYGSAGIGGQEYETNGTIIINSGTITSAGGSAGIGGGNSASGGTVTIKGGIVNAIGGSSGAGIGSGNNGGISESDNVIRIDGGTVIANGDGGGAGIGGGGNSAGGMIEINGGTVIAAGGDIGGTGIGSNLNGAGSIITINGGNITAAAGNYGGNGSGAGIGGGYYMSGGSVLSNGSEITITAGVINATGGGQGAGIGGCYLGSGGIIEISGGVITAKGGNRGADIGGGSEGAAGTFIMSGNGVVFASKISDTDTSNRTNGWLNLSVFYGTCITLTDDLTIPTGRWVTIPSGKTLIIPSHITLTNNGTLLPANGSTVTVNGTLSGNKINGANTEAPVVSGTPAEASITVSEVSLLAATGQDVEYAISMLEYDDPETLIWQSSPVLPLTVTTRISVYMYTADKVSVAYNIPCESTVIIAFYKDDKLLDTYRKTANDLNNTTYYVYARSKENTNFAQGWEAVSDGIITGKQSGSGMLEDIDISTGANKIKVMIWDGLNTMQPICDTKTMTKDICGNWTEAN